MDSHRVRNFVASEVSSGIDARVYGRMRVIGQNGNLAKFKRGLILLKLQMVSDPVAAISRVVCCQQPHVAAFEVTEDHLSGAAMPVTIARRNPCEVHIIDVGSSLRIFKMIKDSCAKLGLDMRRKLYA